MGLLGVYGFLSLIVAGAVFSVWEGSALVLVDPNTALYVTGAIFSGVIAYAAFSLAEPIFVSRQDAYSINFRVLMPSTFCFPK